MSSYMQNEMVLFLQSMMIGLVLVFCYDILISFRKIFSHNRRMIGCEDLLFWLSTSIAVFCHIYCHNHGKLRGYIFLGYFSGAWFYHISLRSSVQKFLEKIFFLSTGFVKKVINGLLFPIKRGKILVYNFGKTMVFGGKRPYFRLKRGNWVEKIKTKGKEKQNSE